MFEITALHSVTLVDNDLKTACLTQANTAFCDCLQNELGPQGTRARATAVSRVSFRAMRDAVLRDLSGRTDEFSAANRAVIESTALPADDLSELSRGDRTGFERCMPTLSLDAR